MPGVLALLTLVTLAVAPTAFDRQPWTEDLDQLEGYLGHAYSNLEWMRDHRGLDLARLDQQTRERLAAAHSEREALEALARFLGAFGDPHLTWTPPLAAPWGQRVRYDLTLTTDGTRVMVARAGPGLCAHKGDLVETLQGAPATQWLTVNAGLARFFAPALARDDALRVLTRSAFAPREGLELTLRRGAKPLPCRLAPLPPEPAVPAAPTVITSQTPGPEACLSLGAPRTPEAFPKRPGLVPLKGAPDSPFEAGLLRTPKRCLGWLRIPSFVETDYPAACAKAWGAFRATFTGACDDACKDRFREGPLSGALVRAVSERVAQLARAGAQGLVLDLTDNGGGTDWARVVAQSLAPGALECPARGIVAGTCDASGAFRGRPAQCSLLKRSPRSPCEPAASAAAGTAPPRPLFIVVNRSTASAAEEVASLLQDNGLATVVGERTLGAGCGYVDDPPSVALLHSGIVVRAPNCVRYRKDGRDEVEGVVPDIELPWTLEDAAGTSSFADKALAQSARLFAPR